MSRSDEGGSLVWGVKSSFRAYVRDAEGIIAGDAAGEDGVGVFAQLAEAAEPGTDLRYTGSLRFDAHGGMLSVELTDPVVRLGEHPQLWATTESGILPVATLGPLPEPVDAGGLRTWQDVPAALTPSAVSLLGGVYPAGTLLDTVSFSARIP